MPQRDPVKFLTHLSRYHKRNVCQKVTTDIHYQMFVMCLLSVRYQIHCKKKYILIALEKLDLLKA